MKEWWVELSGYITALQDAHYTIEANTEEEAKKKAIELFDKNCNYYIDGFVESYDIHFEEIDLI